MPSPDVTWLQGTLVPRVKRGIHTGEHAKEIGSIMYHASGDTYSPTE